MLDKDQDAEVVLGRRESAALIKQFELSRAVMAKAPNNCFNCHSSWRNYSTKDYVSAQIFVPGKPAESALLLRLNRSAAMHVQVPGKAGFQENMPTPSQKVSDADFEVLKKWVELASGTVGDPEKPFDTQTGISCNQEDFSPSPLVRLSRNQYVRSLYTLLFELFGASQADTLYAQLQNTLKQVPADFSKEGVSLADTLLSQDHMRAYFVVAIELANKIASSASLVALMTESCSLPASDNACLRAWISKFVKVAYSRDIAPEEMTDLLRVYADSVTASGGDPYVGVNQVLKAVLTSPNFLLVVETQGPLVAGQSDIYQLSSQEIATRVSLALLESRPSSAWLAINNLTDESAYRSFLASAMDSTHSVGKKASEAVLGGMFNEWFKTEALYPPPVYSDKAFQHYAAGIVDTTVPGPQHKDDAAAAVRLTFSTLANEGLSFGEILLSEKAHAVTQTQANIYGLSSANATQAQVVSPGRGVLLSAANLFSPKIGGVTPPFERAGRIIKVLACQKLDMAAANLDGLATGSLANPPPDPNLTTRQRYEMKTSPGVCQTCHKIMNPIGFALEEFDLVARKRTVENIYSSDGTLYQTLPINAKTTLKTNHFSGEIQGGEGLVEALVQSTLLHACMTKKQIAYLQRRAYSPQDGCAAKRAFERSLSNSYAFKDSVKDLMLEPSFRLRKVAR